MSVHDLSTRHVIFVVIAAAMVTSLLSVTTASVGLTFGHSSEALSHQAPLDSAILADGKISLIHSIRPYEPVPRPPLDKIIVGWNITGSPQWLLNFAIVGFPKCGTSTMMHYFNQNAEVQIFREEKCGLGGNQHVPLIQELYSQFPAGDFVKGIKCPSNVESSLALSVYGKYFPKTDFIVGVRHPVKWLESFYNHRIHNQINMPPLQKTLAGCFKGMFNVCVQRAKFHQFLSSLGKTNLSRDEQDLFGPGRKKNKNESIGEWNGRVFLYEVDQLDDSNEERSYTFREDLQNFLYLRNKLPPMVWFKPGRKTYSDAVFDKVNSKKVDICEDQYKEVRVRLLEIGTNASKWIRNYFLHSPDVVVSNRSYLESILLQWEVDPCADGGYYKSKNERLNCTRHGCFLFK